MKKETLDRLHSTEVEILKEVDRICKKHELKYYMVGGTLLGAVRHKGFIPWDDDLDIAMPRKDFEKFIRLSDEEIDAKFFIQSYITDKYYSRIFAKVRKKNTVMLERLLTKNKSHAGIYIDIFPLDFRENNESIIMKIKRQLAKRLDGYMIGRLNDIPTKGKLKYFDFILKKLPIESMCAYRDKILACARESRSDYYVNYGSQYGTEKQTIPIDKYDPPIRLEFEGEGFSAPRDYDFLLRRIYGNSYMELPPADKRVTHNPVRISFDTFGPDAEI